MADADGTNPHEVVPTRGGMHVHWPAWSHDGQYLYFNYTETTSNGEPAEIHRVATAGGPVEPVIQTSRTAIYPLPTRDGLGSDNAIDLIGYWLLLRSSQPPLDHSDSDARCAQVQRPPFFFRQGVPWKSREGRPALRLREALRVWM